MSRKRWRARPARGPRNVDRPLLFEKARLHRRHQPLQDRGHPVSDHAACRGSAGAPYQLAGREMSIGRYYLKKHDYIAAINRFKTVVTQYQTTRHVEEALARLTEAYMAIGIVSEAQTAAAVLGHNFPDSRWYQDAYNLVRSGGLEPSENRGSYISRAFEKLGLARN